MLRFLTVFIFLITAVNSSNADARVSKELETLRFEAKVWTLQSLKSMMSVPKDAFVPHVIANKHNFSKKGCNAFVNILHNYDINKQMNQNDSLKAELWEMKINREPHEHIMITSEQEYRGNHTWRLEVPIQLVFKKSSRVRKRNFIADVVVKETGNPRQKFEITNWYTKENPRGMKPINYNPDAPLTKIDECDE